MTFNSKQKPPFIVRDGFIFTLIAFFIFILVFADKTEAKYYTNICTSNKCKARVERLNECKGDVKCAVKMTQDAMEKQLYADISKLKEKSSEAPKVGLEDAVWFIAKFEGFRSDAYFDWYANGSNRRSIWYGTVSYKGERITKEEATARKFKIIEPLYSSIPSCFNTNQKISLTSYIYNTGWNQMGLKTYIKACNIKNVKYIMRVYGWNKVLIPRRKAELLKFNLK